MIFEKKYEKQNKQSLKNLSSKILFFISVILFFIFISNLILPQKLLYGDENSKLIPSSRIDTVASSAIVMDYKTGKVLWEKNPDELMYPASTTKMMTAILAIENIKDLNKKIKISKNAAGSNFSTITFKKGDEITLLDLLKAALIASANNATIALAECISGDEKEFVNLMNKKAKEIGALNTNFENTNGLDSNFPYHKTTARDLAIIASYCLKNDLFKEIVSTPQTFIHINKKELIIKNTNTLLDIDYIKGIKTGYTEKAGYCLVTYSNKNDFELISVVLNSSPYGKNYDALRLINWVYNSFSNEKIVDSNIPVISATAKNNDYSVSFDLYPQKDFELMLDKADDKIIYNYFLYDNISLPVISGKSYGEMFIYVNDKKVEQINLISKDNINAPLINQEISAVNNFNQIRIFLIFIISFYFLIFTIIIIRNLIKPESFC